MTYVCPAIKKVKLEAVMVELSVFDQIGDDQLGKEDVNNEQGGDNYIQHRNLWEE